jgi:hypothetical protein
MGEKLRLKALSLWRFQTLNNQLSTLENKPAAVQPTARRRGLEKRSRLAGVV